MLVKGYLVEDDVLQVPDGVAAVVQHWPQDLRRHDEASRCRVDLDVTGDEADIFESFLQWQGGHG